MFVQGLELYLLISIAILLLFNLLLLFLILKTRSHYNALTKGITKKTLMAVLEGIQKTLSTHERALAVNKKELKSLESGLKLSIQNLSLKRFNPFSDTGGDQSFMLSILDGNRDGVVITSLHSRENTRFYVKSVQGGEGVEHPLSKEEKQLVTKGK